jgi:hypothetical protein
MTRDSNPGKRCPETALVFAVELDLAKFLYLRALLPTREQLGVLADACDSAQRFLL